MRRVVIHWTVGHYSASDHDRQFYHFLVEGDGKVVRGIHSVSDNENTSDGDYAAHTRGLNTGSIGVAACCMVGAQERPFRPGPKPLKQIQWRVMAEVVAELCDRYEIAVSDQTVLGHGEVEATLNRPQAGKWDPMILPWAPGLSRREVGDQFRAMVREARFKRMDSTDEPLPAVAVHLMGVEGVGVLSNESSQISLTQLQAAHFSAPTTTGGMITLRHGQRSRTLSFMTHKRERYVSARDLAEAFDLKLVWQASPRKVSLT